MGRIGKKVLSWTLCLMMAAGMLSGMTRKAEATEAADVGISWDSANNRYVISNYAGLLEFSRIVNGTSMLFAYDSGACAIISDGVNEIDASASASGNTWRPIGSYEPYTGTFDGNGKKIKKLKFNDASQPSVGLFGLVGDGGNVKNVVLEGGSITGGNIVGGVAGRNEGTVTNCHNTGAVDGENNVGGVVGLNFYGKVLNCYNTGTADGDNNVGGVVGYNPSGTVENCYNTGTVDGGDGVGGVVGYNPSGRVTNCYNTGKVEGYSYSVGGVVGSNDGTVSNCYNTGAVSGDWYVGGVAGHNAGTVSNCYNTGAVSGDWYVGGVAGCAGTVSNCYYNQSTCQKGAIGGGNSGTNVAGLTTAEMTGTDALNKMEFYYGPGEESPWMVRENDELFYSYYPHLKGFNMNKSGNQLDAEDIEIKDWSSRILKDGAREISNYDELKRFAVEVNGDGNNNPNPVLCGILLNDISASASANGNPWTPIGTNSQPYTGTFDGNGCTIKGLTIDSADNYIGLFGYVGEGGCVQNVNMEGGSIKGNYCVGGVAGYIDKGKVSNCYNTGDVTGSGYYVGGVVGCNSGTVSNCYNTGKVEGYSSVGGVAGYIYEGKVSNCYNTGDVRSESGDCFGGVAGYNFYGTVENCYNTGDVEGSDCVGGVAGYIYEGKVSNCYNTGKVEGYSSVGGVAGYIYEGKVSNCYNTGDVRSESGDCVGGVAGYNYYGTVENCYNTGDVEGSDYVGGVVGYNTESSEVENCYNIGGVKGTAASCGGVVGHNTPSSKVKNCYFDKDLCAINRKRAIGNSSDTENVKGLTTVQMTGEGAIAETTMNFTDSSLWMTKPYDISENGKHTFYYPHLKGFNYKPDGTPETDSTKISADNWPAKVEVKVTWDVSAPYTYDGSEQKPTVTKITVGDDTLPGGASEVKYYAYISATWEETTAYNPTSPGQYKMEYSIADEKGTKNFAILSPGEDYSVTYYKPVNADTYDETEKCINASDYKAIITFLVPIEEDEVVKYVRGQGDTITKEFTILQRELTIQAASETWTYDGAAHSNNTVTITKGSLVDGDELSATATGAVTFVSDIKEGNNPVSDDVKIMRGTEDVTGNYEITKVAGTLSITPATIIITADSASKEYDGTALTKDSVSAEGLATGDKIESITVTGSQTVVGKSDNTLGEAKIVNASGEDVTKCYEITYAKGTLEVTKKALTITADSDTKVYDKTALTKDSYTVSGLADGDSIKSVAIAGSQTMKGSSDNVPSAAKIVNAKGEDVTACYEITYKNGTLTVTAPQAPDLTDDQKPAPKKDLKEDGKEQVLVLDPANLPEGYTIEYSTDGGKTWVSVPTGKESGEYTIEVFYKADENHTDFFGDPLNVIIQGVYNQTESDGDWTKGSGKTYTFRIKKAFNDEVTYDNLTGVFVDGKPVEAGKDYTAAKGSAIITFAADYLETLSVGEHKIRVTFKDGEVTVPLKVLAAIATPAQAVDATPTTGDTSMPILWAMLILLSMAGATVVVMRRRKRA